jgi:tetratricopeptide (TPR) repeat protein
VPYRSILDRIFEAVDQQAYLTPMHRIQGPEAQALAVFKAALSEPDFEPEAVRRLVDRLHEEGRLRATTRFSALHIIAAHPRVGNLPEAARLVGEQELAAMDESGPKLNADLASVDRHRGVLAFMKGHYDVALDYFSRALDRERSAENLSNILCCLVRLRELKEATSLWTQIQSSYPEDLVDELGRIIEQDPDLALLRPEA